MPIASISKDAAKEIQDFCKKHNIQEFFFANDHGAYFGATKGSHESGDFENCVKYLDGMHPENDEGWYDVVGEKFGYDDFGVHLPVEWFDVFFSSPKAAKKRTFSVKINARSVSLVL